MLLNFLVNNLVFRKTSKFKLPASVLDENPLVSILIPARNEENDIKKCIVSLTKQDYKNIEILVLDDNSTDNTAGVVEELSKKDKRIKLYHGEVLKRGWMGKSYACYQLARYARGDYFIFTDADTLHFPDSVSSAVACLVKNKLGALSVFSKQIMVTIHERMIVPFGKFMILCFVPLYLIKITKSPIFCTAIGQFMLFKREVYEKIGGHESVKNEVLDDIKISKQVKKSGYKFMIFDGSNNLYSRDYKSAREVIKGHSKTLFAAVGYKIYIMLAGIIMISAVFLFPFILLIAGLFLRWPMIIIELLILQIAIILITRITLSLRFRCRALDILLHPASVFYLILIALDSVFRTLTGVGVEWKVRVYDVRKDNEMTLFNDNYNSRL
jgi:chlorobactene glucosyltransferase